MSELRHDALDFVRAYKPDIYDYRNLLSLQEMKVFVDDCHNLNAKSRMLDKYPRMNDLIAYEIEKYNTQERTLGDIDCCAMVCEWNCKKQIYKFDADFTNALIKTKTLHFMKDLWNFLPCNCFYADISDNEELVRKLNKRGLFIRINKGITEDIWQVHILGLFNTNVNNDCYNYDMCFAWNAEKEINVSSFDELVEANEEMRKATDPTYDGSGVLAAKNADKITQESKEIALTLYVLVWQILTYLSSAKPDISENTELSSVRTSSAAPLKQSKKQKKKRPDNKVRAWDVGVRFGTAFRKWCEENTRTVTDASGISHKMRPHYRRAHWHSFWYGKRGEERIKRLIWIDGIMVNQSKDELPAVIHNVEPEQG